MYAHVLTDYNLIMFPNQNALGVQEIEVFVGFSAAQAQNILRRPTNLNRYIDMAIYIYIYIYMVAICRTK